jgi:hypothetical protein
LVVFGGEIIPISFNAKKEDAARVRFQQGQGFLFSVMQRPERLWIISTGGGGLSDHSFKLITHLHLLHSVPKCKRDIHTPWCRIFFEKLIVTQLNQTTACFLYGTRRFITVLTKARHVSKWETTRKRYVVVVVVVVVVVNLNGRDHSEDLGVDERIILEWTSEKEGEKLWTAFMCLRIANSGVL